MIEDKEFINKDFIQHCGDTLNVLKKTNQKSNNKNILYECIFKKYPFKILARKDHIINGQVINPQIEKFEFLDKIWLQNCGDSLKILGKSNKSGYWKCVFIKYPNEIEATKNRIINGNVLNNSIEKYEFINKKIKQNCGDTLSIIKKTDIQDKNKAYLFEVEFLSNKYRTLSNKKNILLGNVNNPNFIDLNKYPWHDAEILKNIINSFDRKPTIKEICKKIKCSYSVINHAINDFKLNNLINYTYSYTENEIKDFVNLFSETDKLKGEAPKYYEIDIYIPKNKIGIEYNGNFWHSNNIKYGVNKSYHQDKSLFFKNKNINIIHIFEYEWENKKEILKSLIKSKIGFFSKRIGARKCIIKEISYLEYANFCEKNHLQGPCGAKVKLGLYYKKELIQIMSFGVPRFNEKYEWEIIRECSKLDYCILGGKDKLWKYFIKKYNPSSVISYCDFSKFTGESYIKLGFRLERLNKAGFVWYDNINNCVFWRDPFHNKEMKEKEFNKIYDCGQLVFTWNL